MVGSSHLIRNRAALVQSIDQTGYRSVLPCYGAYDFHAVALVESAGDRVLLAHTEVEIAASVFHDFLYELFKYATPRPIELP